MKFFTSAIDSSSVVWSFNFVSHYSDVNIKF